MDTEIRSAIAKAIKHGYIEHRETYALGVLAYKLEAAKDELSRYVRQIEAQKNDNDLLEEISQEVRASVIECEEDRDELVDYFKQMIRKLEELDFPEPTQDEDFVYECAKDLLLEAEA